MNRKQRRLEQKRARSQKKASAKSPVPTAKKPSLANQADAALTGGRLSEAVQLYGQLLERQPDNFMALSNLGAAFHFSGQFGRAEEAYRRSIRCRPEAKTFVNLAATLKESGKPAVALEAYQEALRREPTKRAAQEGIPACYQAMGKTGAAIQAYKALLQEDPGNTVAAIALATMQPLFPTSAVDVAEVEKRYVEGVTSLLQTPIRLQDPVEALGSSLSPSPFLGGNVRPAQALVNDFYLQACPSLGYVAPHCRQAAATRTRLRVGFISRHLYLHTISRIYLGFLQHFDRDRFEMCALTFTRPDDAMRQSIQASADRFVVLPNNLQAARRHIEAEELDVLCYCDLGFDAMTYFLAFSRLAPVQCTSWGHPVTSAIPNVDYFVSSRLLEIEGAQEHYSEHLVLLDTLPTYYERPNATPRTQPPVTRETFGIGADEHMYCCPQTLFKIQPSFETAVGEILRRDPKGKFVLIESQPVEWTQAVRGRFQETNPDVAERLVFLPRMPNEHLLDVMEMSEVLLDPFLFGSGSTAYEGFAVGTPIVTMPSPFMRTRIVQACYQKMGLAGCVAENVAEYVALATRLACEPTYRQAQSDAIRESTAKLFEDSGAVRQLESFFAEAVAARAKGP